jgi:hypothetical protein
MKTANMSLACFPGLRHDQAASYLRNLPAEPLFGRLGSAHTQIVPQCTGRVDEALVQELRERYPETRFRLHANVRIDAQQQFFPDLSSYSQYPDWFSQAAYLSILLEAPVYTAHAGMRSNASLQEMLENVRRATDLFSCPVGVEGHFPSPGDKYLLSSWGEWREVFDSGLPYVMDMSHFKLLAAKSKQVDLCLLTEMVASDRCLEIHLSDNDGDRDTHDVCEEPPWWIGLLEHAHEGATIFSEANHRRYASRNATKQPECIEDDIQW